MECVPRPVHTYTFMESDGVSANSTLRVSWFVASHSMLNMCRQLPSCPPAPFLRVPKYPAHVFVCFVRTLQARDVEHDSKHFLIQVCQFPHAAVHCAGFVYLRLLGCLCCCVLGRQRLHTVEHHMPLQLRVPAAAEGAAAVPVSPGVAVAPSGRTAPRAAPCCGPHAAARCVLRCGYSVVRQHM
jgi:hypothetical protein